MILSVNLQKPLQGTIRLPASKSYSIRAFMIAACGGESTIIEPSVCDDAKVAKAVAQKLGARIQARGRNMYHVTPRPRRALPSSIHVRESGTVLRFVLPLLALDDHEVVITGEKTLKGRPNHPLIKVLRKQGVRLKGTGAKESIPIRIRGGTIRGGRIEIEGHMSSQFISALLIACAKLDGDSEIHILGRDVVSNDYITMTLQVLARSGIKVRKVGQRAYRIKGGQRFVGLKNFKVPSDYGLAAFLLAAGALVDSNLTFEGHFPNDLIQADGRILALLRRMGVRITRTRTALRIRGPFTLKGGSFCLKDCPDLVPVMSVLALFAKGVTRLYGIGHARIKESDRIGDLATELRKIGARIHEKKDEIIITPLGPGAAYKKDVVLDPHHDHRLAMAFSVIGVKCPVRVKDIGCVAKSYPKFINDFKKTGVALKCVKK